MKQNLNNITWQSFTLYRDNNGLFKTIKIVDDPKCYWMNVKTELPQHSELADFAIKVLSIPMSSVEVERSF